MMNDSILILLIILFLCIAGLIAVISCFKMKDEYFKRKKEREELRKMIIKNNIPPDKTSV